MSICCSEIRTVSNSQSSGEFRSGSESRRQAPQAEGRLWVEAGQVRSREPSAMAGFGAPSSSGSGRKGPNPADSADVRYRGAGAMTAFGAKAPYVGSPARLRYAARRGTVLSANRKNRWLRVPATTFVITPSISTFNQGPASKRRGFRLFAAFPQRALIRDLSSQNLEF